MLESACVSNNSGGQLLMYLFIFLTISLTTDLRQSKLIMPTCINTFSLEFKQHFLDEMFSLKCWQGQRRQTRKDCPLMPATWGQNPKSSSSVREGTEAWRGQLHCFPRLFSSLLWDLVSLVVVFNKWPCLLCLWCLDLAPLPVYYSHYCLLVWCIPHG